MTPAELRQRFALFAIAVRRATNPIARNAEDREVIDQLRRSADGAASNHRAAGRSRSRREFISRIGEALTEADEALYWLEHIEACDMLPGGVRPLRGEAHQLVKILKRSHGTATANEEQDRRRKSRNAGR
jgi:four helix bundle protein